jgi:hypothetical protein
LNVHKKTSSPQLNDERSFILNRVSEIPEALTKMHRHSGIEIFLRLLLELHLDSCVFVGPSACGQYARVDASPQVVMEAEFANGHRAVNPDLAGAG